MPNYFYSFIFLTTIFACNSPTKEKPIPKHIVHQNSECLPGTETINLVSTFTRDTDKSPTDKFHLIVQFISNKGYFNPMRTKSGTLKIEKETSKTFPVSFDTCNMTRYITRNFVMKNLQITSLRFKGTNKFKSSSLTPRFHFEEWKFANNSDRDSAMKIVKNVYSDPNSRGVYEKRYSQFLLDNERIFLLETGAKYSEEYAIEYKKLIEKFIQSNYKER